MYLRATHAGLDKRKLFAQHVWQLVRNRHCLGRKFRREYLIPPYTIDFCCVELKLILEVDGSPHLTEEGQRHDERRDRFLVELGYHVLRIPGYETINDPHQVRKRIEDAINERIAAMPPHPRPLSPRQAGGEGR